MVGLPEGPTWEQIRSLLSNLDTHRPSHIRDRAIILLLSVYGMRIGEVCGLALDDVDWTGISTDYGGRECDFEIPAQGATTMFLAIPLPDVAPAVSADPDERHLRVHCSSCSSTWLSAPTLWSPQLTPRLRHTSLG